MRYPTPGNPPAPDPLASEAVRSGLAATRVFIDRIMTGTHDRCLIDHCGLNDVILGAVRQHTVTMLIELERLNGLSAQTQPAAEDVTRRILDKSASDGYACRRWFGLCQGVKKGAFDGGTPVISYLGQMVPARRLLWQLKYPEGHENHLLNHERLRNKREACYARSRCMNLDHWYKGMGYIDAQVARAKMLGDTRECRWGHLIDASYRTCPYCRRMAPQKKRVRYAAAAEALERLTGAVSASRRRSRPSDASQGVLEDSEASQERDDLAYFASLPPEDR